MDFSPEEIAQFKKRRQMELAQFRATQPQALAPVKKSGRGGTLTSLISEGGAIGGAALGTALLPGIGTIAGAGIGGLLGRLTENQVRDDRWGVGDAAKEGALSGAFASIAPLFKAAKGGVAASKAGGSLDDAIMAAKSGFGARSVPGASRLTNTSTSLKSGVINPKTKASVFGAAEDAEIVKVVDKYVKGANATQKYRNLQPAFKGLSDDIYKALTPIKKKTTVVDFTKKMTTSLADDVNYIPGDVAYERELGRVLNKIATFGKNGQLDARGLFEAKQYFGSQLKGAFGKSGADLSVPQQVRMAVWDRLDDSITALAPKVKQLTTAQSMLIKSAPGLQKNADKAFGAPILGIKSKLLERGIQRGQYTAAKGLDTAAGVSSAISPLTKAAIPQTIGRGLFGGGQELNSPITQNMTDPTMANTSMPANISNMPSLYNESQEPSSTSMGISRDNVLQAMLIDIAENGGKNLAQIKMIYEFANPEPEPVADGGGQGQAALAGLQQLQGLFENAGGGQSHLGYIQRGLGMARVNTDVEAYDKLRKTIAVPLARAMGEKGPLSDLDIRTWVNALPDITDSPEAARTKIQFLSRQLQAMGSLSAGTSLEEALMQTSI